MPLVKLYVLVLLCFPALPVPSTATPSQWATLHELSTELELTVPGVEGWIDSFPGEIDWHRQQLVSTAHLPPLSFAAGLPSHEDAVNRSTFAVRRLNWLEWQQCPACEGAWSATIDDQRRRVRVWCLVTQATHPRGGAAHRRRSLAELWEMTGGELPCWVAAESFRELP